MLMNRVIAVVLPLFLPVLVLGLTPQSPPQDQAFAASLAEPRPVAPKPAKKRQIFANGGWRSSKDALPLMKFLIDLTGKPNPKVCLLPTAQGDAAESIVAYYDIMNQLECRPRHLRLFAPSQVADFEVYLLDMDAIFVGGGNTLNMLAIWKEQGIDKTLRKAWEQGIVLAGSSAGAICWFDQGCTDSRPGRLSAMSGLGWLKGSACPHTNLDKRRAAFHQLISAGDLMEGIAIDEGVGLLFQDDKLVRVVTSVPKARACRVRRENGKVIEVPLEADCLVK
jgi:peptidase E